MCICVYVYIYIYIYIYDNNTRVLCLMSIYNIYTHIQFINVSLGSSARRPVGPDAVGALGAGLHHRPEVALD